MVLIILRVPISIKIGISSKQKQSKLIFNYLNDINWFNMNEVHKNKNKKKFYYTK